MAIGHATHDGGHNSTSNMGIEMIRKISGQDVRRDFFELMAEVEAGGWFEMNCSDHVHWLERKISRRIGCGGQFYGTYLPDGQPLGMSCLVIEDHPTLAGHSEVLDLGVVKSHRRMGHGTRLLRDAESRSIAAGMSCMYLETYAGDATAIAVYEKAGFVRLCERPGANGPDDRGQMLLWKKLDQRGDSGNTGQGRRT
jgi:ribosomal protein S18 acetylase RimI-like enzyme